VCRRIVCMPYVIRNQTGQIVSISDKLDTACNEELALGHPEVQAFLEAAKQQLSSSDAETIRVLEDLVELLIRKKLILFTDLPDAAQQKLAERQRMRSELNALHDLMVGEEDIL